ncbi:MAG: sensor histidine kinase [Rhodanobacteraceae bacterium]
MNHTAIPAADAATVRAPPSSLASSIGDLAHELANPLNAIAITTELAKRMLARGQQSEVAAALQTVGADCARCARLLRDAQDYFSMEVTEALDELELKSLLEESAQCLESRGDIHWREPDYAGRLRGDRRALGQMFGELLRNAFDHGAHCVQLDAQLSDDEVRVRITDDGPGIDPAVLPRIFEPFFSTDRLQHSGTGLALARAIAQAHGGDISVEIIGPGTAFLVSLPV